MERLNQFQQTILRIVCWLGLMTSLSQAAVVQFTQVSDPAGIVNSTTYVESGTMVTSITPPATSSGYTFAYWTLGDPNGTRQDDYVGRALNSFSFIILEPTQIVAHYVLTTQDSNANGIPDWFEIQFLGGLVQSGTSDLDGDGFNLFLEWQRGYHPSLKDTVIDGGISRRRSPLISVNFSSSLVQLLEVSDPVGIVSNNRTVPANSSVALSTAPGSSNGYRFIGWFVGGVRVDQPLVPQPLSIMVTGSTTAVARYVLETDDTDGDGIPDWIEWFYFNNLDQNANSDSDADGFTLSQEISRGYNPILADSIQEGGISRRRSALTSINLAGFSTYRLVSDPAGLVNQVDSVAQGTVINTPNEWGATPNGYHFAYWDLNGIRQSDATGVALGSFSFTVSADTIATAHFLPASQDSDGNGVPDWWELNYFPTLTGTVANALRADGFTLAQEYQRGYYPVSTHTLQEGGISRRRSSGLATLNMQPFERLRFVKMDGILTEFFTFDPNSLPITGFNFGQNVSVALCDWDGDGDLDLFVASSTGMRVFENIGTKANMILTERTSSFSGLSNLVASLPRAVISAGDWNLDGKQDLVIGDGAGHVLLIASPGNFTSTQPSIPAATITVGGTKVIPTLGDLNGDQKPDLLVICDDDIAKVIYHNGSATHPYDGASNPDFLSGSILNATGAAIADINGDGVNDILVSDTDGRIWEYHGSAGGAFTLTSKVWAGSGSGYASGLTIAVCDLDGNGNNDLVGGCANGALVALRDPDVGKPSGLIAQEGAASILLQWNPDPQSRIVGYNVYRTLSAANQWGKLNPSIDPQPLYLDGSVNTNSTYDYHVTGVTNVIYPGNSTPKLIEGLPSDNVTATPGSVAIGLKSVHAKAALPVQIMLSITNSVGLPAAGMDLQIAYDPTKLKPVTQITPSSPTVELSGLSTNVVMTNNGATANGTLRIQGVSGTMNSGNGVMFTLNFVVNSNIPAGTTLSLTITSALFKDVIGNAIGTSIDNSGTIFVDTAYLRGDLNGDGVVNGADENLLKTLIKPKGPTPTASQLAAGDLNGDGKLDQKDLTLLLQIIPTGH